MTRPNVVMSAEWTLSAETAQGAPSGIFHATCLACGAQSEPVDNEPLPVELWALRHTGRHPRHRQFTFVTESFWRVDPAPGNPYG